MTAYYRRHLRSKYWKNLRANRMALAKGLCERCHHGPSPHPLELHHKTYARLGHELLNDVVLLCTRCHLLIHVMRIECKCKRPMFSNDLEACIVIDAELAKAQSSRRRVRNRVLTAIRRRKCGHAPDKRFKRTKRKR